MSVKILTGRILSAIAASTLALIVSSVAAAQEQQHNCSTVCTCVVGIGSGRKISAEFSKECPRMGVSSQQEKAKYLESAPQAKNGERCTIKTSSKELVGVAEKCFEIDVMAARG